MPRDNGHPRIHVAPARARAPTPFRERRTDIVTKYSDQDLQLLDFTIYSRPEEPQYGTVCVYGIRTIVAGWTEYPLVPKLDAFNDFCDIIFKRSKYQENKFDRENFKDLFNNRVLCYGAERLAHDSYLAYWAEFRDVSWSSPAGDDGFHADILLRRFVTRATRAVDIPLGQIRVAELRAAPYAQWIERLDEEDLREELYNLQVRGQATGAADQPIPVEDEYVDAHPAA